MNQNRKLRNLLINPKFQFKYIFWLNISALSLLIMYCSIIYFYVSENYSLLVELSPMTQEAKVQLYTELTEILIKIAVFSGCFLFTVTWIGILFSHRTAGPLYHLKKVFSEIKNGDLSKRVHFRTEDEFQDVATAFNEMMDEIVAKK